MTIFKQINSLLFGLFLLVMCSLVYFQFTETKAFMVNQMESDLNNTSTSLSLMLKPHLETGDEAVVDTLVNVIFEGGFYQQVKLTWLANKKQQEWNNPVVIDGVPQWFVDLELFEAQTQETVITSGWLQLATLEIESNPAIGYRELWRIMNDTAMILSALFILAIMLMRFRLKRILKPLHTVSVHAQEIAQRKFSPDIELPETTELRDVVHAINSMSGQLKQVFKTLDEEVNTLKHDKLVDLVSQLPNRLCLTGQLNSWLSKPGFGCLILAKFDWLEELNGKEGYQLRDKMIRILADVLQERLPTNNENIIARLSNTEFAFLVTRVDQAEIKEYVQSLISLVNQELLNAGCEPNSGFAIGIAERTEGIDRAEFLSQADNAMQIALNSKKLSEWFENKQQQAYSREQWRDHLVNAITKNQFLLQWQPVKSSATNEVLHREMYCRLEIDNRTVKAIEFMPYVDRLALGTQLDRCLLEAINALQLFALNKEPISINLTRDSLLDVEFHLWLEGYLKALSHPEKLYFELHEIDITHDLQASINLASIITSNGAKFAVDHCGRQMGTLDYLQQLKPYFIKLDISLSRYDSETPEDNKHNYEICRALVNIARGLDIKVVVTGIEDNDQLQATKALRIDAYQGYISPPINIAKS